MVNVVNKVKEDLLEPLAHEEKEASPVNLVVQDVLAHKVKGDLEDLVDYQEKEENVAQLVPQVCSSFGIFLLIS